MKTVDSDKKEKISVNIRFLLESEGKTRKVVCNELGFKYTTFCDWINGKTAPGYHVLERLGEYFNVETWTFYEDIETMKRERLKRLGNYMFGLQGDKWLDMDALEKLSDEQLKELLSDGFRFRHRTLEEYVELSGSPLMATYEIDWGEPVGREIW